MKNLRIGGGAGGLIEGGGGLINFPRLKRGGLIREWGLFERGGLNRGFTVIYFFAPFDLYTL